MTANEFNEKYKAYIEEGFETQGLEFDIPEATVWLDNVFQTLTQLPNFTYCQIKVKFNSVRFYTTMTSVCLTALIEKKLTSFLTNN